MVGATGWIASRFALGKRWQLKKNGRDKLGECRARPNSWSLSSPQQPLRRRIHQPSLLPRRVQCNGYAMQVKVLDMLDNFRFPKTFLLTLIERA